MSQSPTQLNSQRHYEEYFQSPSRTRRADTTERTGLDLQPLASNDFHSQLTTESLCIEQSTIQDDDTGVVSFPWVPQHDVPADVARFAAQDDGPGCGDHHSPDGVTPSCEPKTPAPVNPFSGMDAAASAQMDLLHTSQMFHPTQPTSAMRPFHNLSPTSSRPSPDVRLPNSISPNILHAGMGRIISTQAMGPSSPLKGRAAPAPSSPLSALNTSSIVPDSSAVKLKTSSTTRPASRDHQLPSADSAASLLTPSHASTRSTRAITLPPRKESVPGKESQLCPEKQFESFSDSEIDIDLGPIAQDRGNSMLAQAKRVELDLSLSTMDITRQECAPLLFSKDRGSIAKKRRLARSPNKSKNANYAEAGGFVIVDSQDHLKQQETESLGVRDPEMRSGRRPGVASPSKNIPSSTKEDSSFGSSDRIPGTNPQIRPFSDIAGRASGTMASQGASIPAISATASAPESSSEPGADEVPPQNSGAEDQVGNVTASSDAPLAAVPSRAARAGAPRLVMSEVSEPLESALPPATKTTTSSASSSSSCLSRLSRTPDVNEVSPTTHEKQQPPIKAERTSPPHERILRNSGQLPPSSSRNSPALPPRRVRKPPAAEPSSADHIAKSSSSTPVGSLSSSSTPIHQRQGKAHQNRNSGKVSRKHRPQKSTMTLRSTSESREQSVVSDNSPHCHRHQLFEGMAFAISFQSRKRGESETIFEARMHESENIQKIITSHGGRILQHGFDELFHVPSLQSLSSETGISASTPRRGGKHRAVKLELRDKVAGLGFTALIADGHSRKVKYMQALALGLPCISDRWVTSCIKRAQIVSWDSYMLCAGNSVILGDAVRSRHLMPYPAHATHGAKTFAEIIGERPKLLEGQSILLVMKKSPKKKDQQNAYLFLAQVMGATLTRVEDVHEALTKMREKEATGRPFNWVYCEGEDVEDGLFSGRVGPSDGSAGKTRRKRKRGRSMVPEASKDDLGNKENGGGADGEKVPKRIKMLHNEIVVQSLILGRLVDEDEMELCCRASG